MQGNEQEAQFLSLLEQHETLIHKVCALYAVTRHDREDLFQEILSQLWKSYPRFRGESKFSTWLYRIALNTAISGLRKKRAPVEYTDPRQLPPVFEAPHAHDEEAEQLGMIYAAIRQLNEIDRALMILFLEDRSYEEMEQVLGINQNNLRVRMNRIREKIRKLTQNMDNGT